MFHKSIYAYKKAENDYLKATQLEPKNMILHFKVAYFFERLNKNRKAEKIYAAAIKIDLSKTDAYVKRANFYGLNQEWSGFYVGAGGGEAECCFCCCSWWDFRRATTSLWFWSSATLRAVNPCTCNVWSALLDSNSFTTSECPFCDA